MSEEIVPTTLDFEQLYEQYPRKRGKLMGMRKLKSEIKTAEDLALFSKAMNNYIMECLKDKTEIKYVKHWATFCNNWRDYLEQEKPLIGSVDQLQRILRGEL